MKSVKSANKVEACLLYCMDGKFRIRVYDKENKDVFDDYDILHNDLFFKINDKDAYFYEDENGKKWIDHSPETLGVKSND